MITGQIYYNNNDDISDKIQKSNQKFHIEETVLT